jgi:sRNA-binding protein
MASKEAKAADAKMKAAEAAKTKASKEAEAAAAEKATKEKVKAKKNAGAITTAGAPRCEAKDGQELVLTQSPAVDEVVNESASYPMPAGDFEELHKQLAIAHEVCPSSISAQVLCVVISPRGSSRFVKPSRASKSIVC